MPQLKQVLVEVFAWMLLDKCIPNSEASSDLKKK